MKKIEDIKKGDFFKLSETSTIVYVRDEYNREIKKYEAHKWTDMGAFITRKKGTIVFVDFEF
jgi:hypothetical protein